MTTDFAIKTATVNCHSDATTIPAYLAHPVEAQGLPTIVVLQEVFGVNAHIREVTKRLAQEGYIAIAPHIYHRQAPGFEVGYGPDDLAAGRTYKDGTKADELLQDIQGAIAYVQNQFQAVPPQAGCIGFCFGGHVAYLAATLPTVRATATFYGAGLNRFTPGGGPPTISRTPAIQGTIYGFFGLQDPLIPPSEVNEIEEMLKDRAIDHRIYRYADAGHGFFCDRRDSYNTTAADDAWQHVKALFQKALKPS